MSEVKLLDTTDIQILDIDNFKNIDEDELPEIITSQYNNLTKLEQKIADALNKAKIAKNRAYFAADMKVGILNKSKKEAIDVLQQATKGLSESQLTLVEAQEISFEYQSKIALIMKFLFELGASSIAMNRVAVREIKARLENASDEEISDLAKKELNTVLMQLKAQEDVLLKQKKLESSLNNQKQKYIEHDKMIEQLKAQNQKHDTIIDANIQKLEEYHNVLEKLKLKDEEVFEKKFLDFSEELNKSIVELKNIVDNKNKEVYSKLEDLKNRTHNGDNVINNKAWIITISTVASASLILNILQVFGII